MKKIRKYINRQKKKLSNVIDMLCAPTEWFDNLHKNKKKLIICLIVYIFIGALLKSSNPFPFFYAFITLFALIGIIDTLCLFLFSKEMKKITSCTANQPAAIGANGYYYSFFKKSHIYIFIPLAVTIIFEYGGCRIFGALTWSPLLLWILIMFTIVVYISIIGYLQYVALFIYIMKLANSKEDYKNIKHSFDMYVPADLGWIQTLTKLTHKYQSAFFSLGGLYIIAFGLFCFTPQMEVQTTHPLFFILWVIIFFAIGMVFPITALFERHWIKVIITKLKVCYVKDLIFEVETKYNNQTKSPQDFIQKKVLELIYYKQIMNSKDYPVEHFAHNIYNITLFLFNLGASAATIIQGMTTFSSDFLQTL